MLDEIYKRYVIEEKNITMRGDTVLRRGTMNRLESDMLMNISPTLNAPTSPFLVVANANEADHPENMSRNEIDKIYTLRSACVSGRR